MSFARAFLVGVAFAAVSPEVSADDRGHQVYNRWCIACHGVGPDKPGTGALQAKYKGSVSALLEERNDLTADLVKMYVRRGVSVMPPFRKTEISDEDLNALAAYLSKRSPP